MRRIPILLSALFILLFSISLIAFRIIGLQAKSPTRSVHGVVLNSVGAPVDKAVVRIQNSETFTLTGIDGKFELSDLPVLPSHILTAWSPGHYITGPHDVKPGTTGLRIELKAHTDVDHPEYTWLPSVKPAGEANAHECAECHLSGISPVEQGGSGRPAGSLPVDEWVLDAHSGTTRNRIFLTMYTGTDVNGNRSPPPEYIVSRDYGRFPLKPDPNRPYFGPGYKLDFPQTAGNCSACHAPAAAVNAPYGVDPTRVQGISAEGVSCDFCHKIWDIKLNPKTGLPFPNMPGVLSYEFRRPAQDRQFFAGPFDDVAPGDDTCLPLQKQSQFCAGCHFGKFWGTVVYNSFGEWLESPYSDPQSGQSCQDCHMPSLGATEFALPSKGGLTRDPKTIRSHRMPGAADETLLQNAVTMNATARCDGPSVVVEVTILNDRTGHHIPTDSPLRQMILLVQAKSQGGASLELVDGPTLPEWAGIGDPGQGYYADMPGKAFAKILMERWTEVSPTGAYWKPTRIISDNRLAAFEKDTSTYTFAVSDGEAATVTVSLLFRRAFIALMDLKGWDVPDILMEEQKIEL